MSRVDFRRSQRCLALFLCVPALNALVLFAEPPGKKSGLAAC